MAKKIDPIARLRNSAAAAENKLLSPPSVDNDSLKTLEENEVENKEILENKYVPENNNPKGKPSDAPSTVDIPSSQGQLDDDDFLFGFPFEKYLEKMSIKDKTVTVPLSQRQHNIIRFIAAMNQSTINSVIYNITEEFIQKFKLEDFYDKAQRKFNRSYKS